MLASLLLGALALRAGLRLRRGRLARSRRTPDQLRAHLRLAKPAVALITAGFVAGPVSAFWLRGWTPFRSFHAWLGLVAVALFGTVWMLGRRLEHGRGRPVEAHAVLAALAVLTAAIAAVAGLVLLP